VRPNRLTKRLLRAPAGLYSARLGWILDHRFLLLVHRGRRSGRLYRTVLEVVAWDESSREAVVVSGFGPSSQWYKNVLAAEPAEVRIGRERFAPRVRQLDEDEASSVLADYERRNRLLKPIIHRILSKLAGFAYDGSDDARRRLSHALPLVAFRPR
jgi:deazaflavin-dependent oxidoreductase (nitroreductase family)